jgi:poly(A) polymerase
VRFAARFGLTIEPRTADAIRAHAEHLKRISPERIAEELRLMLVPPKRSTAWEMLAGFGLVPVIFRTLKTRTNAPLDMAKSIVRQLSDERHSFGATLAAATLCFQWQRGGGEDVRAFLGRKPALAAAAAMRQALKISNDESDELREILESLAPILADELPRVAVRKRFMARPHHAGATSVMTAIAGAGEHRELIGERFVQLIFTTDVAPPPLITGDDLTAAGLAPGPLFKRVLDQVYDAQLEDRVKTKDAALILALELARSG